MAPLGDSLAYTDRHRILLIEDSDFDRMLISREFSKQAAQAEVTCMSSIKNALADFDASDFDAVVTDINLPDGSGLDVIVYIRSREQDLPILALTGVGSEETAVQAIKFGANDYLSKSNETFRKLPSLIADMIAQRVVATSRDKTLAELRTLQDRFRDFAEAASDLFWETDSEHRLRFVSGSVESVLGADPSAFAGMFLPKLAAGHKVAARMGDAMTDRGAFRDIQFAYARRGSGEVFLRLSGKPYFSDKGDFLGYRGIGTDVTEEVEAERELLAAKAAAEEANKAKTRFLAVMSHELRTPLNGILGFAQALDMGLAGPLDAKQRDYLKNINDAGQYLLSVLNDILDISKIEADRYELSIEEVDLAEILRSAGGMFTSLAEQNGLSLNLDVADENIALKADSRALRQVVVNLVSNGVKFTPRGGRVSVTGRRTKAGIVISVRDTGEGIPAGELDKIAKPFHQVENVMARRHGGSGLGLSIAKGLIEAHGGRLAIESTVGEGTTVTVTLPG